MAGIGLTALLVEIKFTMIEPRKAGASTFYLITTLPPSPIKTTQPCGRKQLTSSSVWHASIDHQPGRWQLNSSAVPTVKVAEQLSD
ncbi:MAG: hypothetical protein H6572_02265 [Lewinellaceae bacterium]|nr:hypothetical protein [Lewinellaceae bacterium]